MSKVERDWYDRYMMPNYAPAAMIPVRGSGSRMWDQEGREYIDFGLGSCPSGFSCRPDGAGESALAHFKRPCY